jgi:hypothetical protein
LTSIYTFLRQIIPLDESWHLKDDIVGFHSSKEMRYIAVIQLNSRFILLSFIESFYSWKTAGRKNFVVVPLNLASKCLKSQKKLSDFSKERTNCFGEA